MMIHRHQGNDITENLTTSKDLDKRSFDNEVNKIAENIKPPSRRDRPTKELRNDKPRKNETENI